MSIKILGIETSCDDTSAAIVEGNGQDVKVLSSIISSQIKIHQKYGGVVPEIASRSHLEAINLVVEKALKKAKTKIEDINAVCTTVGPGLSGSLVVGAMFAKTISWVLKKPVYAVNHIEGHIYANFVCKNPKSKCQMPKFPAIVLVVSGGHTQIVLMKNHFEYKILGQTLDDAAGEAYDKVARVLGLPYPGGPQIEKEAKNGREEAYNFPKSGMEEKTIRLESGFLSKIPPDLNFSFSGLKTAVINATRKEKLTAKKIKDICASFQKAVVDVLSQKTIWATKRNRAKSVLLCGGVSANKSLRNKLSQMCKKEKVYFCVPDFSLSCDNAAMIAIAGYYRFLEKKENQKININPGLKLK